MDVQQVATAILSLCGAVALIGSAGAVIIKVFRPAFALSKRVEVLEGHAERDYRRMDKMEQAQNAICKALLALLWHAEDGNHTGAMKAAREELQNYLIER
jgi:hypothetical protein